MKAFLDLALEKSNALRKESYKKLLYFKKSKRAKLSRIPVSYVLQILQQNSELSE